MGLLIRNGHIVDAAEKTDILGDLYIDDGYIQAVGGSLETKEKNDRVIDACGALVIPGLVDLHVHLRDPGQTEKEDIETGARAAARGGITTLVAMPNTSPVIDSPDRMNYVHNKAAQLSKIRIYQAGAITEGEKGEKLADLEGMALAGAKAFSEDGRSVMNSALLREAMKIAARYDIPVFSHCEDLNLRGKGVMNEDQNAERLHLPGIPNSTEDVIAARDILLAMETGARLHLCHCSTKNSARIMQIIQRSGIKGISAEVCPHHLLLTSDDIKRDDPDFKMNPPLRTREDVEALLEALADGSIQVISTDHAPHTKKDKSGSMKISAFGIVGLETSFPLMYTGLVEKGILSIMQLVEKMCWNPARILGVPAGTLRPGTPADVVIADIENEFTIRREDFVSKGHNTPFDGWNVKGRILYTISGGRVVYQLQ